MHSIGYCTLCSTNFTNDMMQFARAIHMDIVTLGGVKVQSPLGNMLMAPEISLTWHLGIADGGDAPKKKKNLAKGQHIGKGQLCMRHKHTEQCTKGHLHEQKCFTGAHFVHPAWSSRGHCSRRFRHWGAAHNCWWQMTCHLSTKGN